MNQTQLRAAFGGVFSKSRMVRAAGEPATFQLVGKFAEIMPLKGGMWDVFVTDTSSPAATLSERKLTSVLAAVKEHLGDVRVQRLDGEAYFLVDDPMALVPLAKAFGLRKARQLSPEQQVAMRKRMADVRRAA